MDGLTEHVHVVYIPYRLSSPYVHHELTFPWDIPPIIPSYPFMSLCVPRRNYVGSAIIPNLAISNYKKSVEIHRKNSQKRNSFL